MIRPATLNDVATIVRLGEQFHAEAAWSDIVDYIPDDCAATITGMIESPLGIVLVAEKDGQIIGIAGGILSPVYFNLSHMSGQEMFWWVDPAQRRGIGRLLLDALEGAARDAGAKSWSMIALDKVHPEIMGRLYRGRGYRPSEHSHIKVL